MKTTYTSLKEATANVRTALKAMGYGPREISVRGESYSMGSSINVCVKVRGVDLKAVEAVAMGAERVDRCEITGDILSGGNRFVHVKYDGELLASLAATVKAEAEAAVVAMKANPGVAVVVCGVKCWINGHGDIHTETGMNIYPTAGALADWLAHKLAALKA